MLTLRGPFSIKSRITQINADAHTWIFKMHCKKQKMSNNKTNHTLASSLIVHHHPELARPLPNLPELARPLPTVIRSFIHSFIHSTIFCVRSHLTSHSSMNSFIHAFIHSTIICVRSHLINHSVSHVFIMACMHGDVDGKAAVDFSNERVLY